MPGYCCSEQGRSGRSEGWAKVIVLHWWCVGSVMNRASPSSRRFLVVPARTEIVFTFALTRRRIVAPGVSQRLIAIAITSFRWPRAMVSRSARIGPRWRAVYRARLALLHLIVRNSTGRSSIGLRGLPPVTAGAMATMAMGVARICSWLEAFIVGTCGCGFFCIGRISVVRVAPSSLVVVLVVARMTSAVSWFGGPQVRTAHTACDASE